MILTDIYPANESPIDGVHSEILAEHIQKQYPKMAVDYFSQTESLLDAVTNQLTPGDVVVTMGAGTIGKIAKSLAKKLSETLS